MKTPDLKFKNIRGLGDLIACILHSNSIGWLTKIITGKDKPCTTCSKRRTAFNTLIPLSIWKFFYKDELEFLISLEKDYRDLGYDVNFDKQKKSLSVSKSSITEIKNESEPQIIDNENIEGYRMIKSFRENIGDLIVSIKYYKKR